MDTRPRILIVEDVENMRETWIAVLEREKYRVHGAANAEAAIKAIDRSCYHVALVDIMLAGEKDTANRDGVKVLKHLRDLREGTQAIVLSANKRDITLVRDLLKEYDAIDYIAKWEQGDDVVIQKIKDAISKSPLNKPLKWEGLVRTLLADKPERIFVSECLQYLKFNGGFENLSRSLLSACQHLMPLLKPTAAAGVINHDNIPEVFNGVYWSKGQGSAIELLIFGKNAPKKQIEQQWNFSGRRLLRDNTKADLSTIVIERADLPRADFS